MEGHKFIRRQKDKRVAEKRIISLSKGATN